MPLNSRNLFKKMGENNYKGGGTRPKPSKEKISRNQTTKKQIMEICS